MTVTVERIDLGQVVLPDWHPRHAADATASMYGYVVRHDDGVILFDTGCGFGSDFIDEVYRPTTVPLVEALNGAGIDERDVVSIVISHLHFDHCGQHDALPTAEVWLQRAEIEAAQAEFYTVPEWAEVADHRLRRIDGDAALADEITILATPGHTPGHQSMLVDTEHGRELIVGQACYTCAEFAGLPPDDRDWHGPEWAETGRETLRRLHGLDPDLAHFGHDATIWRPA